MDNVFTVGSTKEIPLGHSKLVEFDGKIISVFHTETGWFAMDDRCSHRGGPLSEGKIENGCVICPWHQASFDLKSGHCTSNPKLKPVACYHVFISEDTVHLAM